jgi:hypothetical protein
MAPNADFLHTLSNPMAQDGENHAVRQLYRPIMDQLSWTFLLTRSVIGRRCCIPT